MAYPYPKLKILYTKFLTVFMKPFDLALILQFLLQGIMSYNSVNLKTVSIHFSHIIYCIYWNCTQSCLTLPAPWTVACQAPLPMEFSRQEYWSGVSFPTQGIFLSQGSNPHVLCLLHWQTFFFFFKPLVLPEKSQYWRAIDFRLTHIPLQLLFHFFCPPKLQNYTNEKKSLFLLPQI